MKSYIPLLILSLISMTAHAFPATIPHFNNNYVIVADKDGFVNVRQSESLNSKIVGTLPNHTPFYCEPSEGRYCDFGNDKISGYVHKSRLRFLDNDSEFKTFTIRQYSQTKAELNNQYASIQIQVAQKQLNPKDFQKQKYGYFYKGKPFFGTDGDLPAERDSNGDVIPQKFYTAYFFDNITLTINNKTVSVPKSEFTDLFIRDLFVQENVVFDRISAYINPKNNHTYLFLMQSDGAGTYTVCFEFRNGKYYKKYVWIY